MSHVIPPHVFQVLKSHRWNCNVLGVSQKVRAPELRASFGLRGAWIEFLCSVVGPTRSSWCPGRINPHAYLRTHAQNHGSTCANGAHTTARPHAPTKTPTFPHQQAEKSLQNQHVLSILQVGSHQLQYRFFRINNPKSRHKTNTFCPLTPTARPHAPTKIPTFPHQKAENSDYRSRTWCLSSVFRLGLRAKVAVI